MAEFPENPADGDTHTIGTKTWEYNATDDKWVVDQFGLENWTVSQDSSNRLLFTYNGTLMMRISTTGDIETRGNITAFSDMT